MTVKWIAVLLAVLASPLACLNAEEHQRTLLQNRGSDSMAIAVVAWAEAYNKINPKLGAIVSGGGTGTGIASLLNGTVDFANASRPMSRREISNARERGIAPVQHIVGYDAVAIYLHKDNPLRSLSFAQFAGIYGQSGATVAWTDLAVEVPGCKDQQIVRVGRQNSSGTYGYLRKHLMGGERFKQGGLETQGSRDLVALVANTPCAIGYSSLAYAAAGVKLACITEHADLSCSIPSVDGIINHTYPIGRPLYMITNGPAVGDVKQYLDWVLSDAGQCILLQRHYAPVRQVSCDDAGHSDS